MKLEGDMFIHKLRNLGFEQRKRSRIDLLGEFEFSSFSASPGDSYSAPKWEHSISHSLFRIASYNVAKIFHNVVEWLAITQPLICQCQRKANLVC